MSELKIKPPCAGCPLRELCETQEGRREVAASALSSAVAGEDLLPECDHPWRWVYEMHDRQDSGPHIIVIEALIKLRGKDPAEYGIIAGNEGSESSSQS